jgi:hypothetical protein
VRHHPDSRRSPSATSASGRATRLCGKRLSRRRSMRLTLQRAQGCTRALRGRLPSCAPLTCAIRPRGAFACARRRLTSSRRLEFHAGAARFRQTDGDRLLRRSRAVFPLTDVLDLLTNELPRLRRWRLACSLRLPRAFNGSLFRHHNTSTESSGTPAPRLAHSAALALRSSLRSVRN